jgi:hypothetical protein
MRNTRRRIALVALTLVVAAVAVPSIIGLASAGDGHSLTAVAASATARFHELDAAKAAGYTAVVQDKAGIICIDNQPIGGMGVHYANLSLLGDAEVNSTQPEALVYAPNADGQPKLAALEYIVFDGAWKDAGHTDPPSLFGQQFNFTPTGNRYGLDPFWSLHVWIWQPNSAGLFQPWNPRVHC